MSAVEEALSIDTQSRFASDCGLALAALAKRAGGSICITHAEMSEASDAVYDIVYEADHGSDAPGAVMMRITCYGPQSEPFGSRQF